jgi:hypothetical protein
MVHYRSSKEDFGERPRQNRSRHTQEEEEEKKVGAQLELNSSLETYCWTGLLGRRGVKKHLVLFFLNSVRFPSDSYFFFFFFSLRQI